MPLDVSEDGEAANAEIGLLLGTDRPPPPRAAHAPPWDVDRGRLAVLGPRDRELAPAVQRRLAARRRRLARRPSTRSPRTRSASAAGRCSTSRSAADPWWLHVDLDVLDPVEFAAQGLPDVDDEPGGLTWDQLTTLLSTAAGAGGCAGWSLAIYDPDQDPDRSGARTVVELIRTIAPALG